LRSVTSLLPSVRAGNARGRELLLELRVLAMALEFAVADRALGSWRQSKDV
jgi:hypothetical protein